MMMPGTWRRGLIRARRHITPPPAAEVNGKHRHGHSRLYGDPIHPPQDAAVGHTAHAGGYVEYNGFERSNEGKAGPNFEVGDDDAGDLETGADTRIMWWVNTGMAIVACMVIPFIHLKMQQSGTRHMQVEAMEMQQRHDVSALLFRSWCRTCLGCRNVRMRSVWFIVPQGTGIIAVILYRLKYQFNGLTTLATIDAKFHRARDSGPAGGGRSP
jgi:hypothetical protein